VEYFFPTLDGQQQLAMHAVNFHHCMYNAPRKKRTKLICNHPTFTGLAVDCTGDHEHLPWGRQHDKWATSLEVEYSHALCVAIARLCKNDSSFRAVCKMYLLNFWVTTVFPWFSLAEVHLANNHVESGYVLS